MGEDEHGSYGKIETLLLTTDLRSKLIRNIIAKLPKQVVNTWPISKKASWNHIVDKS